MSLEIQLDLILVKRKMKLGDLADQVGITIQNLSVLKTGKAKAIRFSTLEKLCEVLDCQPGDLLVYKRSDVSAESVLDENVTPSSPSTSTGDACGTLAKPKKYSMAFRKLRA